MTNVNFTTYYQHGGEEDHVRPKWLPEKIHLFIDDLFVLRFRLIKLLIRTRPTAILYHLILGIVSGYTISEIKSFVHKVDARK